MNKEIQDTILTSSLANIPVMLIGETGTGKTTMVKEIAEKQWKTLTRLNLNGETGTDELLGKYILRQEEGKTDSETIWIDWPMLTAIKKWHWLLLDEINAALPEVLFAIQALAESNDGELGSITLPEKEGEVVKPHAEFRLFATANPAGGAYWGTKDFNSATLSRFVVLNIQPLNQDEENKLLIKKFPKAKKKDIYLLTKIAAKLRQAYFKENIFYFTSTRDLVMILSLMDKGSKMEAAIECSIVNKVQDDESREKMIFLLKDMIDTYDEERIAKELEEIKELREEIKKLKEETPSSSEEDQETIFQLTKDLNDLSMKITKLKKVEEEHKAMRAKLEELRWGIFSL